MRRPLRIAINAQLRPESGTGGIETVLRVLAGVATLDDGDEQYVFVGPQHDAEWLRPFAGPRASFVAAPNATSDTASTPAFPYPGEVFGQLDCDVVHFPFQMYAPCAVPTIYNPHDLQHLHYPEFFTATERARRGAEYPAACRDASMVVSGSRFVEDDLVTHFGLPRKKLQTIWWALLPLNKSIAEQEANDVPHVRDLLKFKDEPFVLYPAMTWEHKNHIRLIEALARLRDQRGLRVRLVCNGQKTEHWPSIERVIEQHGLQEYVQFTGLLPYGQLGALYRAARFVVVPTLFEAASAPLFESWQRGKAVTCSNVTSLPEQADGAALLFDPLNVDDMADAISRLWTDDALRRDLERRGIERLESFSWLRMARSYRALYRKVAGRRLSEEDAELLESGRRPGSAEFGRGMATP